MGIVFQAAPLVLAGVGALWTELAGFLAICVEGWMLLGSFFAFCGTAWTGFAFAGACLAMLSCAVTGFIFAFMILKTGADRYIVALALNLGVSGIIPFLSNAFFKSSASIYSDKIHAPGAPFLAVIFLLCLVSAYIIRKTPFGGRLRAAGLDAEAAAERGLNVPLYKILSWTFCASLAGLGGAFLTFKTGVYAPQAIAGRGWLALAAVFLGFRSVRGISAASFAFAFTEYIAVQMQVNPDIPVSALLGLPSAAALALYAVSCSRGRRGEEMRDER